MKKLLLALIVVLAFILPWLGQAYGATIQMPRPSADMYNWEDWDSKEAKIAAIIAECQDQTSIWKLYPYEQPDSGGYCIQVKYVDPDNIIRGLDEMRSAPNCHCPSSSYIERKE